jgi:ABC-type glycerol-3-phosphate transport system substrate-binding protein
MSSKLAVLCISAVAFTLSGCGSSSGSGDNQPIKAISTTAPTDPVAIAKKVDGDFDKLTPGDKQIILNRVGGNEQTARNMLANMAHPPNEASKAAHPHAGNLDN